MMDEFSAFHFLRAGWLLLLVPVLVLCWFGRRREDSLQRWRSVIDPELLRYITVSAERTGFLKPVDALLVAWVLGVIALAGPTWRREPSPFADAHPPVMFVLRAAPSMNGTDLAPSRMERARQKISDLLDLRDGAAAGLVVYSGSAHLVLPPTTDKSVILEMLHAVSPEIMPVAGDRLTDAMSLANQVLRDGGKGGSIVILADDISPDQRSTLKVGQKASAPTTFLALVSKGREGSMRDAVSGTGVQMVETTIDQEDVRAIVHRLDRIAWIGDASGEGVRWEEAGYWIVPLLALFVAGWFRRGWVMQ